MKSLNYLFTSLFIKDFYNYTMSNVFFDLSINGTPGKIVFKLYDDVTPKTASNFRMLATG